MFYTQQFRDELLGVFSYFDTISWYQRLPKREQGRLSPWASAR